MITDLDYLKEFISLKDKELRRRNLIIVDSEKVVNKLLNTKLKVHKILATKNYFEKNSILSNIEKITAPLHVLEKIVGHNLHHGVIAIAERPKLISINEITGPLVVLNGITSPENVGAIVRSCRAFDINTILFDNKSCNPLVRRAIRVSMGNVFYMNFCRSNNLLNDLLFLKKKGISIIGTANTNNATPLPRFNLQKNSAIITGSEGNGIDKDILNCCNHIVKIEINENTAALNASNATAIFAYQLSLIK